jgi:RNA polymerase sigma-70 factor, ECF subfamily
MKKTRKHLDEEPIIPLSQIIDAELPRLRRYALALLRSRDDADDLVQETILRALEKSRLWQPGSSLGAWLFAILHNNYVNHVRRSARRGRKIGLDEVNPESPPAQIWPLELRDLDHAMSRLPDEQRIVLLRIGLEGMTYEQAAAGSAVPLGTIRSRLCRARETLRVLLRAEPHRSDADAMETSSRRKTGTG